MKKNKSSPRDELLAYINSELRFPFKKPVYLAFPLAVVLTAVALMWSFAEKYTGRKNRHTAVLDMDIQVMIAAAAVLIIYVLTVNILNGKYSARRRRSRDIIERYGEQSVVTDWLQSREISSHMRLGNRFLFINGDTLIWLTDITALETVRSDEGCALRLITEKNGKKRVCEVAETADSGTIEDRISLITERRESARSRGH